MWDQVVGPQFKNVVSELIAEPIAIEETVEEEKTEESDTAETVVSDEDDYY